MIDWYNEANIRETLEFNHCCPVCMQKGWVTKITVEVLDYRINYDNSPPTIDNISFRWQCTNRWCICSQDWQASMPTERKRKQGEYDYKAKLRRGYNGRREDT
jgi:hypothetical protein